MGPTAVMSALFVSGNREGSLIRAPKEVKGATAWLCEGRVQAEGTGKCRHPEEGHLEGAAGRPGQQKQGEQEEQ